MKNIFKALFKRSRKTESQELSKIDNLMWDTTSGGVKRKHCSSCGGEIITIGHGVLRKQCSECGKPYYESIYK